MMIVKIPYEFIQQEHQTTIREVYVNINLIQFVEARIWSYEANGKIKEEYSVVIQMSNGAYLPIKIFESPMELQSFILWWNKHLTLEKMKEIL